MLSLLAPFPGTEVRRWYIDLIAEPENYSTVSVFKNAWKPAAGTAVQLMEYLSSEAFNKYAATYGNKPAYYRLMLQAVKEIFFSGRSSSLERKLKGFGF